MTEPVRHHADWHGAVLDVVVITSMTTLTALHIATLTVFLAGAPCKALEVPMT